MLNPNFIPTFAKNKNIKGMKKIKEFLLNVLFWSMVVLGGIGVLGIVGCGVCHIFVCDVPVSYLRIFGICVLIPMVVYYIICGTWEVAQRIKRCKQEI